MDGENVSAFAAYQADIIEEPTPSVPDRSFRDLSRNEMIAHLISKKKQELKRKTREMMDRNSDKVPKRRKKEAAKSTPVSQNNSLSPKEPTLGNGTAAPKKDTAKVDYICFIFVWFLHLICTKCLEEQKGRR